MVTKKAKASSISCASPRCQVKKAYKRQKKKIGGALANGKRWAYNHPMPTANEI
jgi:hypothetical protein